MVENSPPFLARLARVMAIAAITAALLGPLLSRFGVVVPIQGFMLFALALPFACLAVLLGPVALFLSRRSAPRPGGGASIFAIGAGLAILLLVLALGRRGGDVPAIHDITTDFEDPPTFSALANESANQGIDLAYPHGDPNTPALQREAYQDLATSHLRRTPSEVMALVEEIAEDFGWTVVATTGPLPTGSAVAQDPEDETMSPDDNTVAAEDEPSAPYRNVQPVEATVEAYATSKIFRFVDDVVVRVRGPEGANAKHSVVDIRSKSRDGRSDLGANAAHIRDFQAALQRSSV